MNTANETRYRITAFSSTVPAEITPAVEEDEMRPEYDIRGGVRGKYLPRWRRCILYMQALWR